MHQQNRRGSRTGARSNKRAGQEQQQDSGLKNEKQQKEGKTSKSKGQGPVEGVTATGGQGKNSSRTRNINRRASQVKQQDRG